MDADCFSEELIVPVYWFFFVRKMRIKEERKKKRGGGRLNCMHFFLFSRNIYNSI